MSLRPHKFCKHKGCTKTHRTKLGFCDEHRKIHQHIRQAKVSHSLYNNASWRNYSKRFRASAHVCINFLSCGGRAELVDHRVPVEGGGGMWDVDNHQAMCHPCHNRKRQVESRQAMRDRGGHTRPKLDEADEI